MRVCKDKRNKQIRKITKKHMKYVKTNDKPF